jgi:hypothetical protein
MEITAVFRRESRVRWRGNRAFLLFALATALSFVMATSRICCENFRESKARLNE